MTDISREDFYRAIDELKEEALRTREALFHLRSETATVALGMAVLRQELDMLKTSKRDYREWMAMTVIGVIVGAMDYLIHKLVK